MRYMRDEHAVTLFVTIHSARKATGCGWQTTLTAPHSALLLRFVLRCYSSTTHKQPLSAMSKYLVPSLFARRHAGHLYG